MLTWFHTNIQIIMLHFAKIIQHMQLNHVVCLLYIGRYNASPMLLQQQK